MTSSVETLRSVVTLGPRETKALSEAEVLSKKVSATFTKHLLLVNVSSQRLYLCAEGQLISSYLISSAIKGEGQQEGSGQTPLGLHRIEQKFGDGADPWDIFKARVNTQQKAIPNQGSEITSRILWLKGLEPGVNLGRDENNKNVDSHERFIYIHGTNAIEQVGQRASGGCIRMRPEDAVDLYARVLANDLVYIFA